jgi:hypothetical protein
MDSEHARMLAVMEGLAGALKPGDLDATLTSITSAAVELLPQVEYSSITIVHADGTVETAAPTDEMLIGLDKAQGELREGPCYDAAEEKVHVFCPNIGADERFPRYGPVALSYGIRSQAGLRLFHSSKSQGALNFYSTRVGALNEDLEPLQALFSHHAGMAVGYAREVQNLNEAIRTRTVIGQATGVVMERYGLPEHRAFALLSGLSVERFVKLRVIAQEIVEALVNDGKEGVNHVIRGDRED